MERDIFLHLYHTFLPNHSSLLFSWEYRLVSFLVLLASEVWAVDRIPWLLSSQELFPEDPKHGIDNSCLGVRRSGLHVDRWRVGKLVLDGIRHGPSEG